MADEYLIQETTIIRTMDLLAILQKSLDPALFLYIFIRDVRLSLLGIRIVIVQSNG